MTLLFHAKYNVFGQPSRIAFMLILLLLFTDLSTGTRKQLCSVPTEKQVLMTAHLLLLSSVTFILVVLTLFRGQRLKRQLPALPNGAQCFRNLDCASGCCMNNCCFIGQCVLNAELGQVCGLLSINPWGPPGFFGNSFGRPDRKDDAEDDFEPQPKAKEIVDFWSRSTE